MQLAISDLSVNALLLMLSGSFLCKDFPQQWAGMTMGFLSERVVQYKQAHEYYNIAFDELGRGQLRKCDYGFDHSL